MFVETKREGELAAPLEAWRALLLRAADYIERHGHCKFALVNIWGNVCAMGALDAAATGNPLRPDFGGDVGKAYENLSKVVGDIVDWNNAPERTATEVTAKMREVAVSGGQGKV